MNAIVPSGDTALGKGFLITAQQFVKEHYAEKIARGECQVFIYHAAPDADASESEKWAYQYSLQNFGNVDEIATIEVDDGYHIAYDVNGLGHFGLGKGDFELLVWPKT